MTEAHFRVRGGKVDKSHAWCLSVQRCMGEFVASGVMHFDTNNQSLGVMADCIRSRRSFKRQSLHHAAKNEVQSRMQVFLSENLFSDGCSKIEAERK